MLHPPSLYINPVAPVFHRFTASCSLNKPYCKRRWSRNPFSVTIEQRNGVGRGSFSRYNKEKSCHDFASNGFTVETQISFAGIIRFIRRARNRDRDIQLEESRNLFFVGSRSTDELVVRHAVRSFTLHSLSFFFFFSRNLCQERGDGTTSI